MIVYIDILLIENFIVNLFLIITTMKLLKYKKEKTIYLAALIGALYTIVIFFEDTILTSFIMKIMVVLVMCIIINKKVFLMKNLKMALTFLILSFTLSGFSFALAISKASFNLLEKFSVNDFNMKNLILSLMVIYIVVLRIFEFIKDRNVLNSFIFDIEIKDESGTFYLKGLLDTGNGLREPVTNLPCIIIEEDIIKSLHFKSNERYFINFNTISEDGSLQGIKTKDIRIKQDNSDWRSIEAIICGCKNKLSKENEFNALLSRGVI